VTATSRGSSIDCSRNSLNSALVSMVSSVASLLNFSRIGRVKVPTPGPYSTNSRVFGQSTGASIRSITVRLDGMIEPTITGCLRNSRRKCSRGLTGARPAG
jgi:hypothetical protein